VYGRNNLVFHDQLGQSILIEKENNYFRVLKTEIANKLVGTNPKTKRAVFVFFETKRELNEFLDNVEYAPLKSQTRVLTEEASAQEKASIVNYATSSGSIVFFTRVFGRGTDFIIHDDVVSVNGGVHVIQTFLSEQVAEEKQIKGIHWFYGAL
jgi:preprotein translocase subunit SecA